MQRTFFILIAAASICFPLFEVLRGYFFFIGMNVYLLAVHAGAVPLFFALRPSRHRIIAFLVALAPLCLVQWAFSPEPLQGPSSAGKILIIGAGTVALFLLAVAACRDQGRRRAWAREALAALFVMHLVVVVSRLIVALLSDALPITLDRYLYALDSAFGVQVSFSTGRIFRAAPWLASFCHLVYLALPFAVLFLFSHLQDTRRSRWLLLLHFALIGTLGRFCYSAVPAMGPIYQFPDLFPTSLPDWSALTLEPVVLPAGARNAMPSLHTAWALMLLWWTRGQALWLRTALGLFLFFTLFATLGLGEHYLVDLIVAVPFSLAVAPAFAALNRESRWNIAASAVGGGLVALWFILIRSYITILLSEPTLIILLSVISLAAPAYFINRSRFARTDISPPARRARNSVETSPICVHTPE